MNSEDIKKFFEQQTSSSRIKANIVSKYFPKYCNIINSKSPQKEIRFLDLFAGPGKYEDGNVSTPILIGRLCSKQENLKQTVQLAFNDMEKPIIERLEKNFLEEFPEGTFLKKPRFGNLTIGDDEGVKTFLSRTRQSPGQLNPTPTVLFIDPFGYKEISTLTLAPFLKDWGNELFLFFNSKRIHAAIENGKFEQLMREIFPTKFDVLKEDRRYTKGIHEKLNLIISNLEEEYSNVLGSKVYCSSFKFEEEDSNTTSHFIIHFTKHQRGYDLVKQIFYDFDNVGSQLDSIGTYAFDVKKLDKTPINSFEFGDTNIEVLAQKILKDFAGRRLSAEQLFNEHHINNRFSRSHYTEALRYIYDRFINTVEVEFTDSKRHTKSVLITSYCILNFKNG